MRKVDDREKKRKESEKIMSFMVATNVVASQPPKRQLTGTPTDRAKMSGISNLLALKNATQLSKVKNKKKVSNNL